MDEVNQPDDVLGDGWEGEVEEAAWVPRHLAATPIEAMAVVANQRRGEIEALVDEGMHLAASGRTEWMRPKDDSEPTAEENERWQKCEKDESGGFEFWVVEVVEDES